MLSRLDDADYYRSLRITNGQQDRYPSFASRRFQQRQRQQDEVNPDPQPDTSEPLEEPVFSTNSSNESKRSSKSAFSAAKCETLAAWMHAKCIANKWTSDDEEEWCGEGVFIKKERGDYAQFPLEDVARLSGIHDAIVEMNVKSALTVKTPIVAMLLESASEDYVQISEGQRLQILPDFEALPLCHRHQAGAFVRSHQVLVVWADDPTKLIDRAEVFQKSLDDVIWGDKFPHLTDSKSEINEKSEAFSFEPLPSDESDAKDEPRRINLWQPLYVALSLILMTVCVGTGFREVAIEQTEDPNWIRLLFLLALPAQYWLSLFFFQATISNCAQIISSTFVLQKNSKYYSAKPPRRLPSDGRTSLPHVTIQMPVYKEGLEAVIKPTVRSVRQAITTYELQGGTANIFINDDGMQLISVEEAAERQEYYDENGIGWVARPKHNPNPACGEKAFLRRGRFKKASNMNYAMRLSCDIEDKLALIERDSAWTQVEENEAYEEALQATLAERGGEAWADGSIRMGDYILLIDSDTRVPVDCLLESVSEMEQSPEVAILQHTSGVMNVTDTFFEKGITFFTNMIYTMIGFSVASGDVAPFVGHNAFLRWTALQEISYTCSEDKWVKYWSEETVSEDFDMSLRLQAEGFIVRLAVYKGKDFKEGVSLTVYDELNRWEKYTYGCNELIFHPLVDWPFRGPITPLFRRFVTSNIPFASKITVMAYIGTYYAIGSAWLFTTLNYFLVGFFNGWLDHYYMDSFKVYVAIVFVFALFGNVALDIMRSRASPRNVLINIWANFKWVPMMSVFLGGTSLHVSQALMCHFFSIKMEWGATSKEAENVSFFEAMNSVIRKFKYNFLFCAVMTVAMLVCAFALPEDWQIRLLIACWPMASVIVTHALLPIVLNPQLMRFSW